MRTQVAITVDTEFSIARAFAEPGRRVPMGLPNALCPAGGRERGVPFLLDCFARHGTRATFFVETEQVAWFGDPPMAEVVSRIVEGGGDVQLHIHPCWRAFLDEDWRERVVAADPEDDCAALGQAELATMIGRGLERLRRWGARDVVAVRAGNMSASPALLRAARDHGLRIDSSVGVALQRPMDVRLRLAGGRVRVDDVLEVPVLTYQAFGRPRLLTVAGASWPEMHALLERAHAAGAGTVTILTHPFEFLKGDRLDPASWRPNRINVARLEALCAFVAADPRFEAVSFAGAAPAWLASPDDRPVDLLAPLPQALVRMAANVANDRIPAL